MTLGAKNSTPEVGVVSLGPPDVAIVVGPVVGNIGILHLSSLQQFVEQDVIVPLPFDIISLHTVALYSEQFLLTVWGKKRNEAF